MLLAHLHISQTYQPYLTHPVWQKVLAWLNTKAPHLADGEYEIDSRNIYASISTVDTIPRQQAKYEAHRQYIDVHFCIEGGEIIEWAPVSQLTPSMEFNTDKDYCLYESPQQATSLKMTAGAFAIFFPADAHMPKISAGHHKQVRKAVVKIKVELFE